MTWWLKFWLPWGHGNWIFFNRHPHVATKRFSITTIVWRLNSITIQRHWLNSVTIKQWLCILVATNGYVGKFDHHLGENILGWTIRNHLKEWLRNQKCTNHYHGPFTLNVFTTIYIFFHVYQLHALIYGLKFILESKKLEIIFF